MAASALVSSNTRTVAAASTPSTTILRSLGVKFGTRTHVRPSLASARPTAASLSVEVVCRTSPPENSPTSART